MRLAGKVAIIAGAAWGGIGAASALRFAQEGAKLVVNTRNREDKLHETVIKIQEVGGDVTAVMGDVQDVSAWEAMRNSALEHYGRIDILVHNAAHSYMKRALEFTQEEWNHGLAVTLGGPWLGAKHCIPAMIEQGGGSVVFVSTVNATITNPLFGLYGAAKGGLNALTRSIALDYGRDGIRCNAIAPGQIVGEREAERIAKDALEDQLSAIAIHLGAMVGLRKSRTSRSSWLQMNRLSSQELCSRLTEDSRCSHPRRWSALHSENAGATTFWSRCQEIRWTSLISRRPQVKHTNDAGY